MMRPHFDFAPSTARPSVEDSHDATAPPTRNVGMPSVFFLRVGSMRSASIRARRNMDRSAVSREALASRLIWRSRIEVMTCAWWLPTMKLATNCTRNAAIGVSGPRLANLAARALLRSRTSNDRITRRWASSKRAGSQSGLRADNSVTMSSSTVPLAPSSCSTERMQKCRRRSRATQCCKRADNYSSM